MAVIRVIRNKRQRKNYMQGLIAKIWNNPDAIYRWNYGCPGGSATGIIDAFSMVHRAYASLAVPAQCFQLVLEPGVSIETAQQFVSNVVLYIGKEYQTIAVLAHNAEGVLEVTFVVNSVSYKDGCVFYDNNQTYIQLKRVFETLSGQKWSFETADSVLFNNQDDEKRYRDIDEYV